MATLLDAALTIGIVAFIILAAWSMIQHQKMSDTMNEIKLMLTPNEE